MSDYNKPYILLSVIQISSGHGKKELKNVVFILELLKIKNEGILTLNQQMQLYVFASGVICILYEAEI